MVAKKTAAASKKTKQVPARPAALTMKTSQLPAKRAALAKKITPVESELPVGLAKPALRALASAGITSLSEFSKLTEASVANLHGMGPKALSAIKAALKANGTSFANGKYPLRARERIA